MGTHVYAPLLFPSIYSQLSRHQLYKLHKNFFHPSVEKLLNLIRSAHRDDAHAETRRILQDLSARCDPCQRIKTSPKRFRVSFGTENTVLNERVLIYIIYIESDPVLHIVYDSTHFSAVIFLPNFSTSTI